MSMFLDIHHCKRADIANSCNLDCEIVEEFDKIMCLLAKVKGQDEGSKDRTQKFFKYQDLHKEAENQHIVNYVQQYGIH